MGMTELQKLALQKYNKIMMGNGSDWRMIKLFNIQQLFEKQDLTEDDIIMLQQFLSASRREIEHTSYVANTAVYPSSWGHKTTVLTHKITKNAK